MGWYATKSAGDHQGRVADEQTGKTIAVVYEVTDTPVLAAAPDLLAALEAIVARERGEFDNPHLLAYGPLSSKSEDILAIARNAIANAKGA